MFRYVISKEAARGAEGTIYTNIPGNYTPFIHSLELLCHHSSSKIKVQHLIHFHMNASLCNENLDILNTVLPLFLSNTLNYQVFYYYSRITKSDENHTLFPYYVITSQYVLLISNQFKTGILISDPAIIKQYIQEFKHIGTLAKPLFHRISDITQAWNSYESAFTEEKQEFSCLHFQPCYADLFTGQDIMNNVHTYMPGFEPIAEQFMASVSQNCLAPHYTYFSEDGLYEFCRTGKYYGQIGAFFPPCDLDTRIHLLNTYLNTNATHSSYMLKSSVLPLPRNLYFELHGTNMMQILRIESIDKMDFITIDESSICEAFYHFFEYLQNSRFSYSEAETTEIFN